jgi:hypothetical protein
MPAGADDVRYAVEERKRPVRGPNDAIGPIAEVLGLEGERHKPSYRSVIPYVQLSR